MNFSAVLEKLISRGDLSYAESTDVMMDIFAGNVPQAQMAGFLAALRAKGETADEIAGFVAAMRRNMTRVPSKYPVIVDTCGTGGDCKNSFNVSTAAACVVAGAGIPVAKHGNRSVSSRSGSADLLERAGVNISMPLPAAKKCLDEIGVTFLFAPLYHPSMKNVAPVRKELGIRTVFNLLGPLCNPAETNAQVIGVPKPELVPLIAKVLLKANGKKDHAAMVIHESGYDELILGGKCIVSEILNGKIKTRTLKPSDFGMKRVDPKNISGGTSEENLLILNAVLSSDPSPLQDVVTANAALCILCADRVKRSGKKALSLLDAVKKARESIQSGSAAEKLKLLADWSRKN